MIDPKDFHIDQTIIDIELCNVASTMMKYAEQEAQLKLQVETLENNLDTLKANLDDFFRLNTDEKLTEARIKSMVIRDVRTTELTTELLQKKLQHNQMRSAVYALQARKDCLIALAYRDRQLAKMDGWNKH